MAAGVIAGIDQSEDRIKINVVLLCTVEYSTPGWGRDLF